jgi:translation elongation factor P/translation initiation factor 5A
MAKHTIMMDKKAYFVDNETYDLYELSTSKIKIIHLKK